MNTVFERVEEPRFAARLTIASALRTFIRAARREKLIEDLAQKVQASEGGELYSRIKELTAASFDPGYRSPWDAAVAVYLWVLASMNGPLARACATEIASLPRDSWWWTSQMLDKILNRNVLNEHTVAPRTPPSLVADSTTVEFFPSAGRRGMYQRSATLEAI
jgi:hypothetical protein